MKAIDIIDALTRMGNTEGTGVVETPNKNDIGEWLSSWFGGDCEEIEYDRPIKENTKYLYSYDSHLYTRKGTHKEDCRIVVTRTIAYDYTYYEQIDEIFLYEIEE